MCDAQTVGTASLGLQGAGAASSTVGAYFASLGQKTALNSAAGVADINAGISEQAAQSTILAGQREEQKQKMATANLKGSQKASIAANGIDLGSQSAVAALTSTDVLGEADANTIAANAVRSAFGYRTQATNYKNDALIKRSQASSVSPWMAAGTSLLTSAASIGSNYYTMKKTGVFPSNPSVDSSLPWSPSYKGG